MERPIYVSPEDRYHSTYRYTDQIYKLIQWYRLPGSSVLSRDPSLFKHYDRKLDSSLSRSKSVVLQLALCNEWDFFGTFTLSPASGFDRFDLNAWKKSFTQWLRDQRKKGCDCAYVLVPERHEDGSWHAHGLLRGLRACDLVTFRDEDAAGYRSPSGKRLPVDLVNSSYFDWPAYRDKFGYCSLGIIKSHVGSAFYVTKYITKDSSRNVSDVGSHLYYASRGLNMATKHVDFVGRSAVLDSLLVNKYDFCATGFTKVSDNLDWTFCLEFLDSSELSRFDISSADVASDAAAFYECDQLDFWRCF